MTELELEAHRAALRVHCYRMTGSFDDAEDLVQETMLRAWRARATFEGRAKLSTWLHRIATNACLDALAQRAARVLPEDVVAAVQPTDTPRATPPLAPEVPWLQPFPDRLLDPESLALARESVQLAFLAAVQHLPPRQRAALILCDVLGWSAQEVAEIVEGSVAAVTSSLQRAHATLRERAAPTPPSEHERDILARFMAAWERGDPAELTRMLRDDAKWQMPPAALWFHGRAAIEDVLARFPMTFHGEHRMVAVAANRQPAAAGYLRPHGATEFRLTSVHVLRVVGDQLGEITTFGAALCKGFELPMSFSAATV